MRAVFGPAWRRLPLDRGVRAFLLRLIPSFLRNQPRGVPAETVRPTPALLGEDDYFIFSVIDWHYRFQRPQHLACAMVEAGRRVFYVSSNLVAASKPGLRVEQLDKNGRLFQVFLNVKAAPDIYYAMPGDTQQSQLNEGVRALFGWANTQAATVLLQHPFWTGVAGAVSNVRLVYDCMDYHEGFGTFDEGMMSAELSLMACVDLVVVSSALLDARVAPFARSRVLIRNAADYGHFSRLPQSVFRDTRGRRVLGYYGAIADWFDLDLIDAVAGRFRDCLILLIGHDQIAAGRRLMGLDNVKLIGEIPYADLPRYLHGFDVCLLPFLINDLTLATNPVKVYEYLSAGKPVVSVDLPELQTFEGLVVTAENRGSFLDAIAAALENPSDPQTVESRRTFAAKQTWAERGHCLIEALAAVPSPSERPAVAASGLNDRSRSLP
jgi:glycosyltransferase involved in cell wall biosynthesis